MRNEILEIARILNLEVVHDSYKDDPYSYDTYGSIVISNGDNFVKISLSDNSYGNGEITNVTKVKPKPVQKYEYVEI